MSIWVISDDYGGTCRGFKTFDKAMAEFKSAAEREHETIRDTPHGVSRYTFYSHKDGIQYHLYEVEVEE